MPEDIYEINDHLEKIPYYRSFQDDEALKEVNFRAYLDRFVWYLLLDGELLDTEPDIYFEILLNLSRCSDYNIGVKKDFLIDVENSRIVVINSSHYNNTKYKFNHKKLMLNPIKKGK